MSIRTRIIKDDGFEMEVHFHNTPDPVLAAQAFLPLLVKMLNKQLDETEVVLKEDVKF